MRGLACQGGFLCSLEVKEEDGKLQGVEWTGNSRWMPVTIGLVGPMYGMQAIGPTLRLTSPYMVRISPCLRPLYIHSSTHWQLWPHLQVWMWGTFMLAVLTIFATSRHCMYGCRSQGLLQQTSLKLQHCAREYSAWSC